MRNVPKNYRDENYRDPVPAGICPMCGEPVYPGDPCYIIDGDMIHADGVLRDYRERGTNRPLRLSCLSAYILEDTGAAIKGNKIDLYFDSHQDALEWGVQSREVFVIE